MADEQAEQFPDTREKILTTACRLFSQQGYENTSLSQVAREAKVSKALIFWHFDTKEKLFEIALRKTLEPYSITTVDEWEVLDENAQLGSLIDQFFDFVRENVYSVRFFLSLLLRDEKQPGEIVAHVSALHASYRDQIAQVIDAAQRKGTFRTELPPTREATLIMAALEGLLVQQFLTGQEFADSQGLLADMKASIFERLNV